MENSINFLFFFKPFLTLFLFSLDKGGTCWHRAHFIWVGLIFLTSGLHLAVSTHIQPEKVYRFSFRMDWNICTPWILMMFLPRQDWRELTHSRCLTTRIDTHSLTRFTCALQKSSLLYNLQLPKV